MEHHCFTFHMDRVFGFWVGRLFNQSSATKKTWKSLERDTWSVSGNRPLCYQSFLIVFFVLRWKSSGWKRWEHVGEQCHASLSSRLAVDGRHESVWIRCSMDGGVIRARAKVQIWRKTCILISLYFSRIGFLIFVFASCTVDLSIVPLSGCSILVAWRGELSTISPEK